MLQHCIKHRVKLLFCGPTGTGKTAYMQQNLMSLPKACSSVVQSGLRDKRCGWSCPTGSELWSSPLEASTLFQREESSLWLRLAAGGNAFWRKLRGETSSSPRIKGSWLQHWVFSFCPLSCGDPLHVFYRAGLPALQRDPQLGFHGCWETFCMFAYCGLVVESTHATAKNRFVAPLPTSTKVSKHPQGWMVSCAPAGRRSTDGASPSIGFFVLWKKARNMSVMIDSRSNQQGKINIFLTKWKLRNLRNIFPVVIHSL